MAVYAVNSIVTQRARLPSRRSRTELEGDDAITLGILCLGVEALLSIGLLFGKPRDFVRITLGCFGLLVFLGSLVYLLLKLAKFAQGLGIVWGSLSADVSGGREGNLPAVIIWHGLAPGLIPRRLDEFGRVGRPGGWGGTAWRCLALSGMHFYPPQQELFHRREMIKEMNRKLRQAAAAPAFTARAAGQHFPKCARFQWVCYTRK